MNPFSHHEQTPVPEHPFAEYIRILGKGKKGSRPLTQDEAYQSMTMILRDEVLPVQLGAFLMLMRVKEETPEELAGFVQAVRENLPPTNISVDLDWSSYAGKRRHLPWFLLSALLLAQNGIRIVMHGSEGHTAGRLYTENMLSYLGLNAASSMNEVAQQLEQRNFSYLALKQFCPKLHDIIELRPLLGLRSPVHTLVRLINPFNARHSIQGIFHPGYRPVHQLASALLGDQHTAVLKGEGGETERNPDVECLVQSVRQGEMLDETWSALFTHRHVKDEQLDPNHLALVWQGKLENEYAVATIIGTAAIALKLLGKVNTRIDAEQLARKYWLNRNIFTFSGSGSNL
jgi:anthranilate phosphoribosyltransferase